MLRTTCVATELAGGHAPNALPQRASANVNCRILPGHTAAEVQASLVGALADPEIKVALAEREIAGPRAEVDPVFLETVERVSAELFPGVPVVPMMSSGATDSKYFRLAGSPPGVSGLFVDVDDVRARTADERLGVKDYEAGVPLAAGAGVRVGLAAACARAHGCRLRRWAPHELHLPRDVARERLEGPSGTLAASAIGAAAIGGSTAQTSARCVSARRRPRRRRDLPAAVSGRARRDRDAARQQALEAEAAQQLAQLEQVRPVIRPRDEAAAAAQDAPHLAERTRAIGHVVEHVIRDHEIEALVREGELLRVGLAQLGRDGQTREPRARLVEHARREIREHQRDVRGHAPLVLAPDVSRAQPSSSTRSPPRSASRSNSQRIHDSALVS
jgi:hypothetical protein